MSEKASDRYFRNEACPYFPCHPTGEGGYFNCLFCYCPLYALGDECGGRFYYAENGVKCCDNCTIPHERENYGYVMEGAAKLCERMKRK